MSSLAEIVAERRAEEVRHADLEKRERIARCRDDLLEFFKTYLPHHFSKAFGEIQLKLIKELQKAKGTGMRKAIIFAREHGKTTIIEFFALWCILYRKKDFIIIICDSRDQASLMLQAITDEIEGNDLLIEDFGDLVGKSKWGKFEILTRGFPEKNTTTGRIRMVGKIRLMARGARSAIRGLKSGKDRPDLILLDDLENDENVLTPDLRNKLEKWLKRAVLNTIQEFGDVLIVGTIIHFDSLLLRIKKQVKTWTSLSMKAIENGKIMWEANWSRERLDKKREEIGSEAFSQEFLNTPIDEKEQAFKMKFLRTYESKLMENCLDVLGPLNHFITWDIAWSEKKTAHWTAMVVIAVDTKNNWWVRDIVREKMDENASVNKFFDLYYKYNCIMGGMETVFRQKYFKDALLEEGIRRNKVPYIEDLKRGVADKHTRIRSQLGPRWQLGTVFLPIDHPLYHNIEDEILQFPKSRSDDIVDALSDHVQIAFPPHKALSAAEVSLEEIIVTVKDPETGTIIQRDILNKQFGQDHESWLQ